MQRSSIYLPGSLPVKQGDRCFFYDKFGQLVDFQKVMILENIFVLLANNSDFFY